MKLFYATLIALALFIPAIGQNSKEDLTDDITSLRNDIKDIEAEIADAKINYPEDIPELEKELAATKKMLAAFEKMAGMPSTPPAAPTVFALVKQAPKSPTVHIKLSQPVKAPSPDQATDQFFGHKGRKINDSTLITSKGLLVQIQHSQNRLVCQADSKNDPFKHIIEELEKSEQRKDELIDYFIKMQNGTLYYPQLEFSLKIFDDLEQRYKAGVSNSIDIPDLGISNSNSNLLEDMPGRGPDIGNFYNAEVSDKIEEIKAMIKAAEKRADELEAQLPPWDQFPPPPRKQNEICFTCDPKILRKEFVEDSIWRDKFQGKEEEIMRLRLGIERQKQLLGIDDEMANVGAMMGRMGKKTKLLEDKYGDKPEYAKTVIPIILGVERQKELLGAADQEEVSPTFAKLIGFDYPKYLKEQMGLKNYNFVANIAQHIGFERQIQLLSANDEDNDQESTIEMAMEFNRFALTLDLDFIYEQVDHDDKLELRATGSISTKDKVYVRLYPDKCSWRIILLGADYNNASEQRAAIPLQVKSGEKTVRDKDDNLVTFPYTGLKDLVAYFPEFKIDLCDLSKKDSAFMMPVNLPYGYTPKLGNDLNKSYKEEMVGMANHMFVDLNKMEGNESEAMDLAADIVATLSESNITDPTGNPKLDKMQREYNIKVKQDAHKQDLSQLALTKKSVFLFNANNGSTVFIDQTNDTKHDIDEYTKLVKGQIHLRVVHDPGN